jgi:hypothetical protein
MPVSRTQRLRVEIASRLEPTASLPPLDPHDRERLLELEQVVDRGLGAFVTAGLALKEIRDSKLYRERSPRFGDYCQQRWRLSRFYAHRLIQAAEVARDLLPIGNHNLLTCEAQARELSRLKTPEERRKMFELATLEGAPTATRIRETIREQRSSTVLVHCPLLGVTAYRLYHCGTECVPESPPRSLV